MRHKTLLSTFIAGLALAFHIGPAAAADALVARGAYLVKGPVACGSCHTPLGPDFKPIMDKTLAGGFHFDEPAFNTYSANITPDKETGIGGWTDEEIIHAIREGAEKDGRIIFPPMPVPTYNNMSDDDAKAIVAYLRTVKPVKNAIPLAKYNIPQQTMPPAKGLPAPPKSDKVAYGGYIVNALGHCFECHTTAGPHGAPDFAGHLGAGGFEIKLGPGMSVMTANITPDKDTGIGSWTDAQIARAITDGIGADGHRLSPPMAYAYYKNMTTEDVDAVVAYLRTIPPISNKVERTAFQQKAFPR
ncbi:c-type cytochrome [Mesorhizobium sp. BR1-1-16]|uniref:cytochrome c n=1 Tax=Mesorhizobium sp. BR1-1-16 TaxID=2876653 RepID=UPI001CCFF483|nr:cytochrome c [Mesorhizobium sp. BR1-1-16]MBZ9934770.1 c-type cytochrome [Mesorhizobium sp. BR1-1-16]